MDNTIILLNSLLLLNNTISPSFKESYEIVIPTSIDLSENGSFEISLNNNNLSSKDNIIINTDDVFTLSDSHGKPSISGSIENSEIIFTSDDSNPKTINYTISNPSAGDWRGNLNINIHVETQSETNKFLDGSSINIKLNRLKPVKITFSHDTQVNGNYYADLSKEADGSILAYYLKNANNQYEITITNMRDDKFIANEDMSKFFYMLSSLTTIEHLDYIDMSTCTNMAKMFAFCSSLTNIDVSSFNVSNVINMSETFRTLTSCTNIGDISNWNVSNVETFEYTFSGDGKLNNYGDLGKWNVSNKCTNISNMFANMSYTPGVTGSSFFPANLNLNKWDVSNVTNMSNAFYNAFNLQTLDISDWRCNNATNMDGMFKMYDNYNTSQLNNIIGIDNLNVAGASKIDMFLNCNQLSKPTWYQ